MGDVIKTQFDAAYSGMTRLANSFPSMKGVPGIEPWDTLKLLRWVCSGGASHGEMVTGRFLLGVWNSVGDWDMVAHREGFLGDAEHCKPFDIFEALIVWDGPHRSAFLKWAQNPWHP